MHRSSTLEYRHPLPGKRIGLLPNVCSQHSQGVIANIFPIIGASSIISPLAITKATIHTAAPFMVFMTVLFLVFMRSRWHLEPIESILFLLLYGLFLGYIFFSSSKTP